MAEGEAMVYYDKNGIVIRGLRQSDAKILTEEEIAQGWDTTIDKFERYPPKECGGFSSRQRATGRWRTIS